MSVAEPFRDNTSHEAIAGAVITVPDQISNNLFGQNSREARHDRPTPPAGQLWYFCSSLPPVLKNGTCHLKLLLNFRHFALIHVCSSAAILASGSRWRSPISAADNSQATLAHSPRSPRADQIKCFITLQSIQSLFHFLSLCLIRHLYLLSDSIHFPAATFLLSVPMRQPPAATVGKLCYI